MYHSFSPHLIITKLSLFNKNVHKNDFDVYESYIKRTLGLVYFLKILFLFLFKFMFFL